MFLASNHCVAPDQDLDLDLDPDLDQDLDQVPGLDQDPDLDLNLDQDQDQDPDLDQELDQDQDQDLDQDPDLDIDNFCFLLLSIYFRIPKLSTVARRTYQVPFGSGCASVHSLSVNEPVS